MTTHTSSEPCLPESYDTYQQYVRQVCRGLGVPSPLPHPQD